MLLMIPGPIEVSPAVRSAHDVAPPGHTSPPVLEAFGSSLEYMLDIWQAGEGAEPYLFAGSGTAAMEFAAANIVSPEDSVLVVNSGYFSDRMGLIVERLGGKLSMVSAEPGFSPKPSEILEAAKACKPVVIFATHVDTSTGVCVDPASVVDAAREVGALSVFDGVCATAAEPFAMAELGADAYLTGSQKALGLPPGLAHVVFSREALAKRSARGAPPSLYLDLEVWRPIMESYRARKPSYFATPATNLVMAAAAGMKEIVSYEYSGKKGINARTLRHRDVADAMGAAWEALGLNTLTDPAVRGVTLSALRVPEGLSGPVPPAVAEHGVAIAGGLYPGLQASYFRVGHMGYATTQQDMLERTVVAVGTALSKLGHNCDVDRALAALQDRLD